MPALRLAPFASLTHRIRVFRRDERGTTAIIFALTAIIGFVLAGGAIDYGRAITARHRLQGAVDAAVLAGGRVWQIENDLALAEAAARSYFETMRPADLLSHTLEIGADASRNALSMQSSALVSTPFLSVANIPSYAIDARSEATLASGRNAETNLEIAMMLDATGSMAGSKIDDLKAAAKDLIDIVVWENQGAYTSKVSLVPFADAVHLGSTAQVAAVRGPLKASSCTSSSSPCTSFTTGAPSTTQWTYGAPARWYKFQRPDGSTNTWQASSYCVTSRIAASWTSDIAPTRNEDKFIPSYGSSSANTCGYMTIDPSDLEVNSIQPLTNDKALLKRRIDKLVVGGSTAGQIGISWAWYTLSPAWSTIWGAGHEPSAYHTEHTEKIAILMTDGEFNTSHCNGVVAKDSGAGSGGNSTKINCNSTNGSSDAQARTLCAAMKNETGITVYTIGFALAGNATAIETLKGCASDTSKFYEAEDGPTLRQAFRDIAIQVSKLRLSQ